MKATLSFDLPDEQGDYDAARQGMSLFLLLQEFDNWLRAELKYATPPPERESALTAVRDKLYELLSEESISLWE
jgi:hypothetical protein